MATAANLQHISEMESPSLIIRPMVGTNGSPGTSSTTDSAAISSNDFLTLLVTEMQNQDPTANTDPNEYINQLVNVNSLQQLISINQTLSGAVSSASPKAHDQKGTVQQAVSSGANCAAIDNRPSASPGQVAPNLDIVSTASTANAHSSMGNLAIPRVSAAATAVARSLSENVHFKSDR
jgi:flagellar basal-body rod modification protein FlgD